MKDSRHREAISQLYRVWERYETPPTDENLMLDYFQKLMAEINPIFEANQDDPVTAEITLALAQGLSNLATKITKEKGTQNDPV